MRITAIDEDTQEELTCLEISFKMRLRKKHNWWF